MLQVVLVVLPAGSVVVRDLSRSEFVLHLELPALEGGIDSIGKFMRIWNLDQFTKAAAKSIRPFWNVYIIK